MIAGAVIYWGGPYWSTSDSTAVYSTTLGSSNNTAGWWYHEPTAPTGPVTDHTAYGPGQAVLPLIQRFARQYVKRLSLRLATSAWDPTRGVTDLWRPITAFGRSWTGKNYHKVR